MRRRLNKSSLLLEEVVEEAAFEDEASDEDALLKLEVVEEKLLDLEDGPKSRSEDERGLVLSLLKLDEVGDAETSIDIRRRLPALFELVKPWPLMISVFSVVKLLLRPSSAQKVGVDGDFRIGMSRNNSADLSLELSS